MSDQLFDLTLTDEQRMTRESVQRFAAAEMTTIARDADEAGATPEGFFDKTLELGLSLMPIPEALGGAGSTDMGNVSYRVPSIHPMLACAPPNVVIHHPDFARWAGSEKGDAAALDGAKILALTAAEYLLSSELQQQVEQTFAISKGLN